MELTIRYATREDALLIADLSRQTFYDAFAADNTEADMQKFLAEQFTRGRLILEVGAPRHTFLLATVNNQPAGYVKLRETQLVPGLQCSKPLEIARLYCTTSFIGKGVGSALMQRCIEIAKEQGNDLVWLGVWEKNERAIAFYQRWGFEKFGTQEFLLGDDIQNDWLMKKRI